MDQTDTFSCFELLDELEAKLFQIAAVSLDELKQALELALKSQRELWV